MVRDRIVILLACAAATLIVAGCGSDGEGRSARPPEADDRTTARVKQVADRCRWTRAERVPSGQIRSAFAGGASRGEIGLLLSSEVVRPGEVLELAIDNRSGENVAFGTPTHIEHAGSGERVRIEGPYLFPLIQLFAEAGRAGPCVSAPVPSSTPAGEYRAVLDEAESPAGGPIALSAPFEVAGPPIQSPAWERALERAQERNRHSRGG